MMVAMVIVTVVMMLMLVRVALIVELSPQLPNRVDSLQLMMAMNRPPAVLPLNSIQHLRRLHALMLPPQLQPLQPLQRH